MRNNPEELGIPKSGMFDLAFFMEKAYGIGDFKNIRSVEGLGHVYCQRVWDLQWNCSEDAHGILRDGQAEHIPVKSLTMMHGGLGLMLAESLGLVTLCFNFPLVGIVQRVLADVDPIRLGILLARRRSSALFLTGPHAPASLQPVDRSRTGGSE